MASNDKVILEQLCPIVESHLKSQSNEKSMLASIGKFIDRNMEYLSTSGPCYRITISDKDKTDFYTSIGLNEVMIKDAIKRSSYIGNSWAIMTNPFYTACAVTIRHFINVGKNANVKLLSFFLCVGMYPLIHHKYFKYNCNENIMNYTVSHLSNKYKYKQLKSVYSVLEDLSSVCTKTHEAKLKIGGDAEFTKYINDMHARLNDNLKNVAVEYYKNHESGNYLNVDEENNDPDSYREADNSSYIIERIVNDVITKISMYGPNLKMVSIAAKMGDVSVNEMRNIANCITNEDNINDFKQMIQSILHIYIFDMQRTDKDIRSKDYIVTMLEVYKRTGDKDINLNTIRKLLDDWVVLTGLSKRISRKATLSSFKKAMYIFAVLTIQNYL
jgi:hypothetical protein